MRVYGRPGSSADRLLRRRLRWHRRVGLLTAAAVVASALLGRPLTALVAVIVGLGLRHRLRRRATVADVGAEAEIEVAGRLRRYRPAALLFDVDVRGRRSDVDAIVLGPVCAAIEIKRAGGRAFFLDDGRVRMGGRWLPGRPLGQTAAHAAAVGAAIDVTVEAVLCLTRLRGRPRIVEYGRTEVWVTSARHLRRVLSRLPHVLDRAEAKRAAALLARPTPAGPKNPSQRASGSVQ